jgi:hypothetical protein
MATTSLRNSAISTALSSIAQNKRLPHKVFVERWEDYLFFEPHMMFDVGFVDVKNLLMREENASMIALLNLGSGGTPEDGALRAMFLEQDTGPTEYISKLKGDGSAMNWMFLMDRYVCASDKGHWSIYCEKEDDVAVFAFREGLSRFSVAKVGQLLNAKSIRSIDNSEGCQLFDFNKLVPEWRSTLRAEYSL